MKNPYPQSPPIAFHFEVETKKPMVDRRDVQAKAQWMEMQLQTIFHDPSIKVRAVFE